MKEVGDQEEMEEVKNEEEKMKKEREEEVGEEEVDVEVMAVALDDGEQLPRVLTFAPINCS